jgi:hypothetical protein
MLNPRHRREISIDHHCPDCQSIPASNDQGGQILTNLGDDLRPAKTMIQPSDNHCRQAKETTDRKQNPIPGFGPLGGGKSGSLIQRVRIPLQYDQPAANRGGQEQNHIHPGHRPIHSCGRDEQKHRYKEQVECEADDSAHDCSCLHTAVHILSFVSFFKQVGALTNSDFVDPFV